MNFKKLCITAAILLSACTAPKYQNFDVVGSEELEVVVVKQSISRSNGVAQVQFVLHNTSDDVQHGEYHVLWYGGNDELISEGTWRPYSLLERQKKYFNDVAPARGISSYRVEIKQK